MHFYLKFDIVSASKRRGYGRWIRPLLLVIDCLLFNLFFWITMLIYPEVRGEGILWLFINTSLIPVLIYVGRYQSKIHRAILIDRALRMSIIAIGIHALFFLSSLQFFNCPRLSTVVYIVYYAMLFGAETIWTVLSRKIIKRFRKRGFNYIRVAIVGTNDISRRVYREMMSDGGFGYRVLGFFDYNPPSEFEGKFTADISTLAQFVKDKDIDQIYYTRPGNDDTISDVMKIADDNVTEFFYVPMLSQYVKRCFNSDNIGTVPLLAVMNNPLKHGLNRFVKRTFDILFASTFLIFYPFIYIVVASGIKLSSPGPVYFKQERTGYKGKPFLCYKFRSMAVNKQADEVQAVRHDARVTKFGEFLRKSSIDELPQFINVLKGDMSIVGPRPHMLKHTEEYAKLVDRYMVRHMIKPGITGWAQVNGLRGQTDELWKMEKRVENDVWYIEHWSFLLDLKIIGRTVLNALKRDENAF